MSQFSRENISGAKTRLGKEERDALAFKRSKRFLIQAWLGFAILMALMVPMWLHGTMVLGETSTSVLSFIISLYIVFVCGSSVIKSGWISARHLSPNMHVLTSLGSIAALITGVLHILYSLGYFPIIGNFVGLGGMVMTFYLSGSFIEQTLKRKSTNAIKSLISLSPSLANLIRDPKNFSQTEEIATSLLVVGNLVLIRSGEKIPCDGKIIDGEAEIDESLITGESNPVYKVIDDKVIGGSINLNGRLVVEVEKIGKHTFLQQVIRLVEQAQGSKPQAQILADKITAVFVPIILVVALVTFVLWILYYDKALGLLSLITGPLHLDISFLSHGALTAAIYSSIAVLVIACPCALGLATPAAIAIGVGRGAQLGVLIKNSKIFENLGQTNIVVMDKTGTITEGRPSLVSSYALEPYKIQDVLYYASSLEQGSQHPLALSVIDAYRSLLTARASSESTKPGATLAESRTDTSTDASKGTSTQAGTSLELPKLENFLTLPGKGLSGLVNGETLFISNMNYLKEKKYVLDSKLNSVIEDYLSLGLTLSAVLKNDQLIGLLAFKDRTRDDSKKAIQNLHDLKYSTLMLTGDNEAAASLIAKEVGIDRVIANAHPNDKQNTVIDLQGKGDFVIMVGDGINDAPALTQAHVGVAMGSGTDVAANAGDIILLKSKLSILVTAISLSKKTYAIIKENLFWAFIYNIILIPLAVVGLIHPLYAEIAMGLSSITVLLNSIRLTRFNRK